MAITDPETVLQEGTHLLVEATISNTVNKLHLQEDIIPADSQLPHLPKAHPLALILNFTNGSHLSMPTVQVQLAPPSFSKLS